MLGRLTYEGLSTVWPGMSDPYGFADRINSMPKYVASRTLDPPLRWNASLIEGDPAGRVAELKQELTGNLLIFGCGELAYHLARHGLVDEIRLGLHPVVWGDGVRSVPGRAAACPAPSHQCRYVYLRARSPLLPAGPAREWSVTASEGASRAGYRSMSTITGAWSLGPLPLRVSRSTQASVTAPASAAFA